MALVDTNIFVYAADREAGERQMVSRRLVGDLTAERRLLASAQVLNELYHALTRKGRGPGFPHEYAADVVRELSTAATVVPLSQLTTMCALDALPRHGFSFWDALIRAAKEAGATILYTEDFQHGRVIEGVRIVNPFLPES
jgi:predicted nucleic acid-binding protein